MEIKNRFTGVVIGEFEIGPRANLAGADFAGADLYDANLSRANLAGAILRSADLAGADLAGANLFRANLFRADLRSAILSSANLSVVNLFRADLYDANLSRAKLNWQSHNLLGEILRRAAEGNMERRALAGLVVISTDKCHDFWMGFAHPEKEWAVSVLRQWDCEQSPAPEWIKNFKGE